MQGEPLELSVVMPCLDEADTLATCISKAQRAMAEHGVRGEVIVADNGSRDDSVEIAEGAGARVVHVAERGYGSALMGGIAASRGEIVLMGDADDSYDFLEIPAYVDKMREGYDLVQGCRLPRGGGRVLPGAMPFLHRWFGNPLLSALVRLMFGAPVTDTYCGMRAFTRDLYQRLDQRCTGMEFATEMIIKSTLHSARIGEVPITLHPDGRRAHGPHLRTFRDGWRTLRFFLLFSPRWLFLVPGVLMVLAGLAGYAAVLPGLRIGGVEFGAHSLLVASLAILMGYQSLLFAIFSKTYAIATGLVPEDARMSRFFEIVNLERGLLIGFGSLLLGIGLIGVAGRQWRLEEFGALDYAQSMRWVIPGVTLAALGFQTILSGWFVSVLGMTRVEMKGR
ncbi:MAG: glycosyltransferase family 2 protein [Myxococcota bacterium]|nr:glycosyltransferase family 2 protein [Myxococcota bacterium]